MPLALYELWKFLKRWTLTIIRRQKKTLTREQIVNLSENRHLDIKINWIRGKQHRDRWFNH